MSSILGLLFPRYYSSILDAFDSIGILSRSSVKETSIGADADRSARRRVTLSRWSRCVVLDRVRSTGDDRRSTSQHLAMRSPSSTARCYQQQTTIELFVVLGDGDMPSQKFQSLVQSSRSIPFSGDTLISLQHSVHYKLTEAHVPKISSISAAVSIQYRRVTDKHTDRHRLI